ncbi:MAG: DUF2066 domain-containing protein [Pseudomonadota bacterium]
MAQPLGGAPSLQALHTVAGINIDVTADDAVQAREQAISAAQRAGLSVMIIRLTQQSPDTARQIAATLPTDELAPLVSNFQVAGERSSAVRYIGQFTVEYRPERMRRFFRAQGIAFTEALRPPMLVLPIWQGDFGDRLWDSPNPWFDSWSRRDGLQDLLSFRTPSGGLADMQAGNVDQVLIGQPAALTTLRDRYGTESVTVMPARLLPATNTTPLRLAVEYREYGLTINEDPGRRGERVFGLIDSNRLTVTAAPGEDERRLIGRATQLVIDRLNTSWKQQNIVALSGGGGRIAVAVAIDNLAAWRRVQQQLSAETAITGVTILSLAKNRARVALDHLGSVGDLRRLLAQRGLTLSAEPLSLDPSLGGVLSRTQPGSGSAALNPRPDTAEPDLVVTEPTYLLTTNR